MCPSDLFLLPCASLFEARTSIDIFYGHVYFLSRFQYGVTVGHDSIVHSTDLRQAKASQTFPSLVCSLSFLFHSNVVV